MLNLLNPIELGAFKLDMLDLHILIRSKSTVLCGFYAFFHSLVLGAVNR